MLHGIYLKNFRRFESKYFPLEHVTVFVGANSAGKSTILHALRLLRQTWDETGGLMHPLVPNGALTRLNSFRTIVRDGADKDDGIEIGLVLGGNAFDSSGHRLNRGFSAVSLEWEQDLTDADADRAPLRAIRATTCNTLGDLRWEGGKAPVATFHVEGTVWRPDNKVWGLALVADFAELAAVASLPDADVATYTLYHAYREIRRRQREELRLAGGVPDDALPPLLDDPAETDPLDFSVDATWGGRFEVRAELSRMSYEAALSGASAARGLDFRLPTEVVAVAERVRDRVVEHVRYVLRTCFERLDESLNTLFGIGPLRAAGRRVYEVKRVTWVGPNGEDTAALLAQSPELHTGVNGRLHLCRPGLHLAPALRWIDEEVLAARLCLGGPARALGDSPSERPHDLMDVGVGYSQMLPLLAQVESQVVGFEAQERDSLLMIEQPELHLHPALHGPIISALLNCLPPGEEKERHAAHTLTAELGGEVADLSKPLDESGACVQLILETHSDVVVKRLMRMVRSGAMHKERLCVVILNSPGHREPVEIIRARDVEGFGSRGFELRWPWDFFSQADDETMA